MKHVLTIGIAITLFLTISVKGFCQDIAVKTNLAYDAATTMTLAFENKLAPKWTFELGACYNPWEFKDNKKWKNWCIMPEARYWFCEVWDGHFVGAHVFGGQYNFGGIKGLPDILGTKLSKLEDKRYQGWYIGAGVAYGYDWILSRHWNLEAEIGLGWAYTRYDEFRCAGCGKRTQEDIPHNYFGPTKAAINLIYIF